MRVLNLRSTVFAFAIPPHAALSVALAYVGIAQGDRKVNSEPQSAPSAKPALAKPEPEVRRSVVREVRAIWLRVLDAAGDKPIPLARLVITNGNLAHDLGDDSSATAWPD